MTTSATRYQNEFRAADAFEYVDAYRSMTIEAAAHPPEIRLSMCRDRIIDVSARIGRAIARGEDTRLLLAAYRGYEHAMMFLETGRPPEIVKLDDTVE